VKIKFTILGALVLLLVACGGRDERPNRTEPPTATAVAIAPTLAPTLAPPTNTRVPATATVRAATSTPAPTATATRAPATTTAIVPITNEYKTPNTYQVKIFDNYSVRDAKRNRSFQIRVRYPDGAPTPLPLIVWSHGGGPNNNGHRSYDEWGGVLARAGYAVIHIAHAENKADAHCAPLKIPANECEPEDFRKEVSEGGTLYVLWYDRPRDASAVLDDLDSIERAANLKFDRARIGVAGHSGGTSTVMSLAGALLDVSPSVHNLNSADPRFKAFLANSPQGIGRLGMTKNSWDKISAPVMITTGARDNSEGEQARDRLDPAKAMPPPDKYLLYIDSPGATHNLFGLNADNARELETYVATSGIAFFDAYLRGSAEARAWLNSNAMSVWSNGIAKITAK
jgi:predicted dienelactone hydrolase